MKILAIETSTLNSSIAVLHHEKVFSFQQNQANLHAETLLPEIDKLLHQANLTLNQLDAIAFGAGPGSFTGLRIGAGLAQGLAFAHLIPIIKISSLAAHAQYAYETKAWATVSVAVDARMQSIYLATYGVENGLMALQGQEQLIPVAALATRPIIWAPYGIGSAWLAYPDNLIKKPAEIDPNLLPHAKGLLAFAKKKYDNKEWLNAKDALPVYLMSVVDK